MAHEQMGAFVTRTVRTATLNAAQSLEQSQDSLWGYPARGTQADGSSHPRVPQTWSGEGKPPVGWTSWRSSSVEDEDGYLTPTDGDTWLRANDQGATELVSALQSARRFSTRFSVRFW